MLLPKGMVEAFAEFARRAHGIKLTPQPIRTARVQSKVVKIPRDILYKGMWGEGLLIVREHYPYNEDAETVEVYCSNREKLEEIETNWHHWVHSQATKETDDGTSSGSV